MVRVKGVRVKRCPGNHSHRVKRCPGNHSHRVKGVRVKVVSFVISEGSSSKPPVKSSFLRILSVLENTGFMTVLENTRIMTVLEKTRFCPG